MKILIVSATIFEMAPLMEYLNTKLEKVNFFEFKNDKHSIYPLVSGVGSVYTAMSLCRYDKIKEVDVVLNMGIAGAFDKEIKLGDVFEVERDRFADLGVEEEDENFIDVHELDLIGKNYFPFEDGWIINEKNKLELTMRRVSALTVNKVHGSEKSIARIKEKYKAELESMEGAAFMLACKTMDLKFHQIRAVSNYVEPRNKNNWKIDLAIDAVNDTVINIISS